LLVHEVVGSVFRAIPGYTLNVGESGAADLYAALVNKVSPREQGELPIPDPAAAAAAAAAAAGMCAYG
jgi:hypothetical protein